MALISVAVFFLHREALGPLPTLARQFYDLLSQVLFGLRGESLLCQVLRCDKTERKI